ncbi:kinesin motor domain-containing protein [Hirsutella rhossiliensis]|uniref:Kinesin motor domain-containing protein n=1 Tax=Hirsutella rhossiliensis TaxID=111463 RepID=A0A9P8MPA2_9HYPO|nr:kinesin motor domain-containing protein [Hirsutella rhossiliensis]KAH0958034.1 kinesin motor domain-containing protein [Hirsutella rhossiliensis]
MSIRVVARIRPLLEKELDKDMIVRSDRVEPGKPDTIVKIPNPKNEAEEFSFAFNGVYDQPTSQETLFTCEVQPHLKSLFQGYDVTIFAYGVTGTGKTHTMRGGLKLAERGVIPRLLSGIFRRGRKIAKDTAGQTTARVSLSYYEIYNDKVFDLLEPPEKRTPAGLPLRAEANGRTVVAGLSERACEDLRDFEKLYIEANANRVTAATKLNAHSSRSHAILRVKLTQTTGGAVLESTASAIDLAGSEDNRRTDNGKERLVESAAINKSLFVLSQCIDAISRGDKRIPYRESKMTRILSLGQNKGITVMILNLAPLRSYHLDTLSSLNVSSRAKRIEVREIENEVVFKQVPRANPGVAPGGIARQPLRPLANAHNVHNGNMAAKAAEANKPVKAFSVYTDKAKTSSSVAAAARSAVGAASLVPRPSTHKRPLEHEQALRQAKAARPAAEEQITMSAADIEAMVEKKVSEMLAARTAAAPASSSQAGPQQADLSEAVQKRLEALERRVEGDDWRGDTRSDGLRYLLAARQCKQRGDDAAALRAYEMALPYFPGQAKLLSNIERLRSALSASAEDPLQSAKEGRRARATVHDDEEWEEGEEEERGSDGASPRTRRLLDVVNSRDMARIRGLAGFGAKRAQDLIDYLELAALEADDGSGGGSIESLEQLRALPGMGWRTVERAHAGLTTMT